MAQLFKPSAKPNLLAAQPLRGLYLITNNDPLPQLLQKLDVALATGQVALLQYRRKHIALEQQPHEIEQILSKCLQQHVPLIINDNIDLAEQFGCGVHLGQSDGCVREARQSLGQSAIIGRTCGQSLALAQQALADGASYVAFGAVYATSTKPEAKTMDLAVLSSARQQLQIPICTIGGLSAENAHTVIQLGSDLCAVIGDVLDRPIHDIAVRIHAWAALFAVSSRTKQQL